MKVSIEMSAQEWVDERDMLEAHLEELLTSPPALKKSAAGEVQTLKKPHPAKAIHEMTENLKEAYQLMIDQLTTDVLSFMHNQVGKEPH